MEESIELIQDECVSENADHSTEEPAEGGPDADGEEMTDGIEEDFDEDGGHELVGTEHLASIPFGNSTTCQQLTQPVIKIRSLGLLS